MNLPSGITLLSRSMQCELWRNSQRQTSNECHV